MLKKPFFSLFGCDSAGLVRSCNDCPGDEPNRIVHVALYRKGATLNKTRSGFIASLLNLEKSCDAYIVRNVNGTMADAAYQTGRGFGKQISRVLSGTHSITFADADIINNIENFWNSAIPAAQNYWMVFFTSSVAWIVEKPLTISPSSPISDDINTFIEGSIKIDWSSKGLPVPLKLGDSEVDKLESCPSLFENLTGFVNKSGSLATISTDGFTISLDSGDSVNASLATNGILISDVEVVDGDLPSGISVSVDTNGLGFSLTGISTETGTKTVSIRATNSCGVGAEFIVKIVIS